MQWLSDQMEKKDIFLREINVLQEKASYRRENLKYPNTSKVEKSMTINMDLILINILKFIMVFGL